MRLNRLCAAAMRPYVKLLWPLVISMIINRNISESNRIYFVRTAQPKRSVVNGKPKWPTARLSGARGQVRLLWYDEMSKSVDCPDVRSLSAPNDAPSHSSCIKRRNERPTIIYFDEPVAESDSFCLNSFIRSYSYKTSWQTAAMRKANTKELLVKSMPKCSLITFCVSRRRRKMYCGHPRLCVCLSAAACPHYCTDPDVTWGSGRGCPLVVHYWADLQSVHARVALRRGLRASTGGVLAT